LKTSQFDNYYPTWQYGFINQDVFVDNTRYEEFGLNEHETQLSSFDLDRTFMPSADISYPEKFKFHGVEIYANGD